MQKEAKINAHHRREFCCFQRFIVIYHDDQDGFASALVAWHALQLRDGYELVYFKPFQYKQHLNMGTEYKDAIVYILDFSFDKETLDKLDKVAKDIRVIDHHASSYDELKDTEYLLIHDPTRAGCVLAWNHFFPSEFVPPLLLTIQDRDLWLFIRTGTKAVCLALDLLKRSFLVWQKHLNNTDELYEKGMGILQYVEKEVERVVKGAAFVINFGESGLFAVAINTQAHTSDVCHYLIENKHAHIACCYYDTFRNAVPTRKFEVRSLKGTGYAREIAECYGGGGHPDAAGFEIPLTEVPREWLIHSERSLENLLTSTASQEEK